MDGGAPLRGPACILHESDIHAPLDPKIQGPPSPRGVAVNREDGGVMGARDPFLGRLSRVERVAEALERELATLRRAIGVTRGLHERGLAVSEILLLSPEPASHERVAVHIERVSEALHDYRVEIVRRLIEEEGWSISEVARRMGGARQVISRLYHSEDVPRNGTRPRPKARLRGSPGCSITVD